MREAVSVVLTTSVNLLYFVVRPSSVQLIDTWDLFLSFTSRSSLGYKRKNKLILQWAKCNQCLLEFPLPQEYFFAASLGAVQPGNG